VYKVHYIKNAMKICMYLYSNCTMSKSILSLKKYVRSNNLKCKFFDQVPCLFMYCSSLKTFWLKIKEKMKKNERTSNLRDLKFENAYFILNF